LRYRGELDDNIFRYAISKIFQAENWIVEAILNDYTQRPRIITVLRNK